ncbi:MAG: FAD-dependent oxidoreductase [Clostridia bacterium]|nr:FAD-dependent oxidoreductase [Clostridia bacterium]
MDTYTFTKKLNVKKSYDAIVVGGGVAGCASAVTIAKNGKSVLLIEKTNLLGGLATIGLINLFVPMCNGRGKQIIFGLAEKWLRDSEKLSYNTIAPTWQKGQPSSYTEDRYMQFYSPNIFALQLLDEVVSSGVDVLYDCIGVEPITEAGVVKGVVTDSKSGLEVYPCKYLVDTTGDSDLLRRMGVPVVKGENFYSYFVKMLTLDGLQKGIDKNDVYYAISAECGGGINLYGDNQPPNVPKWSGTTVEEVTDYLIRNQLVLLDKISKTPKNSRDIITLPTMPQFRTTCRIDGDYTFSVKDCYRHFDDSVCAINDFDHKDYLYEVPYRSLIKTGFDNVITAGRSISASGYGWDLVRVIPPAILTGQASGEAVSLALDKGLALSKVDVKKMQSNLEKANVMIHFPDEYVPEDKTVVIHGKNQTPTGHF